MRSSSGVRSSRRRSATRRRSSSRRSAASSRSARGVVNIGLEGMMLMGAFFAVWGADVTGTWTLGLAIGIAAGAPAGRSCTRSSRSACAPTRSSAGRRSTSSRSGSRRTCSSRSTARRARRPTCRPSRTSRSASSTTFPAIGNFLRRRLRHLNLMIWIGIVARRRRLDRRLQDADRAANSLVGEHPRAADTVGINVYAIRYGAVIALGDARGRRRRVPLARHSSRLFDQNMTAGRGFIALAALIFGNWRPFGAAAACLLFGFSSALTDSLQDVLDLGLDTSSKRFRTSSRSSPSPASIGRSIPPPPLAARTSSSSVRSASQAAAWGSLVAGLASVVTLPVAVYLTRFSDSYDLLHAGLRDPGRRRARRRRARSRATSAAADGASRSRDQGGRGVATRRPRPRRSSDSALRRPRSSRSASTGSSSTSALATERRATDRLQCRVHVRHRLKPPRGSSPPGPRLPRARGADEDPPEVPPRARGRAVRHPARHPRTCVASSARTPRRSGSTDSRSSTSTTRASRSVRTMRRCARVGCLRLGGSAGLASRGSPPSRSSRSRSRPRS